MEGFDQGGVLPFWESGGIMSMQSLQSVTSDQIRRALEQDPSGIVDQDRPRLHELFHVRRQEVFRRDRRRLVARGAMFETITQTT